MDFRITAACLSLHTYIECPINSNNNIVQQHSIAIWNWKYCLKSFTDLASIPHTTQTKHYIAEQVSEHNKSTYIGEWKENNAQANEWMSKQTNANKQKPIIRDTRHITYHNHIYYTTIPQYYHSFISSRLSNNFSYVVQCCRCCCCCYLLLSINRFAAIANNTCGFILCDKLICSIKMCYSSQHCIMLGFVTAARLKAINIWRKKVEKYEISSVFFLGYIINQKTTNDISTHRVIFHMCSNSRFTKLGKCEEFMCEICAFAYITQLNGAIYAKSTHFLCFLSYNGTCMLHYEWCLCFVFILHS